VFSDDRDDVYVSINIDFIEKLIAGQGKGVRPLKLTANLKKPEASNLGGRR
jgi:hypothetical protein